MKRFLAIVMLLATLCAFTACKSDSGKNKDGNNKETAVTVDIKAVKDKIITDLEIVEPLEIPAERACGMYYLDAKDVKDSACVVTMGGAFPDEIIIFEATDAEAAARIAEKLEAKLQDTINQATNYDADSLALLKECKVETAGNYVHLFISAKSAQMREIFNAAKK